MAETTKTAKSASAKPKKTAAKKKSASAATSDPVTQNHHAEPQEHAQENGRKGKVSQEEIARLAHRFWQERGHKHGHHIEDWVRAENELSGRAS